MGWANKLIGWATGNGAEVDSTNRLLVNLAQATSPTQVGSVRMVSEVDVGTNIAGVTLTPTLVSPEADYDSRLRVANDTILDNETYNYTAQNTGKHSTLSTTMVPAWTVNGLQTNSTSITTTTTGVTGGTWAMFPMQLVNILYCETKMAFSAAPTANTIIDFGMFMRGASNPYAPTDGVYFRLTSAGMFGVQNWNGSEVTTAVFTASLSASAWAYNLNQKYVFLITADDAGTWFWINNILYGFITTPAANAEPFMSTSLPWSYRHAITGGAAGVALIATISAYNISFGGPTTARSVQLYSSGAFGSYQGLSGGTMGSLALWANSANPSAFVPANAGTGALVGLGGQVWETNSLAVNTDGVLMQYTVPAGTVNVPGKRLFINGIFLGSYIQTVLVGGPNSRQYFLGFGSTALTLATGESASGASPTTKAARRVALPAFNQQVLVTQAVNTVVSQLAPSMQFINPIVVNPGEFVVFCVKVIGTVGSSGTIAHTIQFDYSWE